MKVERFASHFSSNSQDYELSAILREKICLHVAKHPRYPRDLYDACARGSTLSYSEFHKLLNEMARDGEICINANNLVVLPKPAPESKLSSKEPPASTNEILIHCLVNRSRTLKHPKQKKSLDNRYYAHNNYKVEQIPINRVYEETLLRGYQFIPGEFRSNSDIGIRNAENWKSQQLFLVEFDDPTEESLDEFIAARPFVEENAWLVTESLRSRYDAPNDATCNGQLRVRAVFCLPRVVKTTEQRDWIYKALEKEMPDCDDGSANSITNGGLGNASAEYIKIGKIVDTDWFNTAIETGQQEKAEDDKAEERAAEARKRKQAERAAMGVTEREGELPLEALAKSDPSLFLEYLGLSHKSQSGQYQHWGRPEKQGDIALSIWKSDHGNWQIRVFANSIPIPPSVAGAMPFTRFYCYRELNTDIAGLQPDSQQWKDINAKLASLEYGTWLTNEEFNTQNASKKNRSYTSYVRLSVSEHDRETQEIEEQADKISAKLCEWEKRTRNSKKQHLLNITTAAGTRKTTVSVHHFDMLLYIAKTKEEADQAFSIADRLQRDAWRHRPRMYNRDNDAWHLLPLGLASNQRPCIYPETCDTLAQRGHAPAIAFCQERCEVYSSCREKGFLAQTEIERKKQSVFLSWNEAFFSDEQFRSRVKRILNKEKMLILDEANPAGLPQHRFIDHNELLTLKEAWRLPDPKAVPIFTFLETLIHTLSNAKEPEQIRDAIRECVKDVTDDEIQKIDDALSKIPLGVVWQKSEAHGLEAILIYGKEERRVCVSDTRKPPKGYDGTLPEIFAEKGVVIDKLQLLTVSLDVFDRAGFLRISRDPEKVPRRYTTLLSDLKAFADSESTACHRTKSTIEFFLPPGLNAPRGITLTASDKGDLMREVYRGTDTEVETLTGLPPPFQPGCKYFQIATGRYTTKKGLLKKEDGVFTGIQPFYKRALDIILKVAERYEVLVVAPKDAYNPKLDPCIERLHIHPNIEVTNHHHAEGRNDFQHCNIVFMFHFEPHPDEIEKIARRVHRNQNLSFDREETDIIVDGVKLAGVMRYTDERVQKVYDRECESRHMQSLMRLRPMINPNKLLVSLSAEPVSRIPIAPVPFTLPQTETYILDQDGDLAEFDAYLEKNATRSVKDISEQDGVHISTAYRRTRKQRTDSRAETEEQVLELANQGLSQRKIKGKLGISLGKVQGILKKHKVT